MTFDELWPYIVIPGEFDAMDQTDQDRWRHALEQAYQGGVTAGLDKACDILLHACKTAAPLQ